MTATLLAALVFGLPVNCYPDLPVEFENGWYAPAGTSGFYLPAEGGGPLIGVRGRWCQEVRHGSPTAAWLLAHELTHHRQALDGRPFDEAEADRGADRLWRWVRAKLRPKRASWVVRLQP